jgi:hypothetical protein
MANHPWGVGTGPNALYPFHKVTPDSGSVGRRETEREMGEDVTGVRMGEASQQVSGSASSDPHAESPVQPGRTRPKVLIPPVTSPLPADPPKAPAKDVSTSRQFPPKIRRGQPQTPQNAAPVAAAAVAAPVVVDVTGQGSEHTVSQPVEPMPPTTPQASPRAIRTPASRPGVARVFLTHVDPWSVMKQAFLLSLAFAIIILVASASLWFALDSAGVFAALTRTATDVGGEGGANVGSFLSFSKVMGVALVLAGIETVLVTALITLFAFLYNLAVGIGGGLEVTLSEEG